MGYMENEQSRYNQSSLYDRVKKLLASNDWSDCNFMVSGKCFKAHKLILGTSSPVFEAMLYGPLSTNEDIVIVDIQPDIFQLILNYIYTDAVDITYIEQAFELLYASRKYLLEHLTEICITYIQTNISVDNVIDILNYPEYMHDKRLISFALKLFCEHAGYLLQEKKKYITHSSMKIILENNQMNIPEKDLIKHVFEWTENYCTKNNIPHTLDNRRNMLVKNGLLQLLRFLTLTLEDLEDILADTSNLLLPYEADYIKKMVNTSNTNGHKDSNGLIGITSKPRNFLKLQWYLCHRSPLRSVGPIIVDTNVPNMHCRVKANKTVFVNSLCIPTRIAVGTSYQNNSCRFYSEQLSVKISCETDNSITKLINFMNRAVEYDSVVDIKLPEPFVMKKEKWYKISFTWPKNRHQCCLYVGEYREQYYYGHKINFEFEDQYFTAGTCGSFLAGLKFCM